MTFYKTYLPPTSISSPNSNPNCAMVLSLLSMLLSVGRDNKSSGWQILSGYVWKLLDKHRNQLQPHLIQCQLCYSRSATPSHATKSPTPCYPGQLTNKWAEISAAPSSHRLHVSPLL